MLGYSRLIFSATRKAILVGKPNRLPQSRILPDHGLDDLRGR